MVESKIPYVRYHVNNYIATIEFYHPAHNALLTNLLDEISSSIQKSGTDNQVKLVVVKSRGDRTFCAGANFDELAAVRTPEEGEKFFNGFAEVINTMRKCPKPIVGRVQGKAVGGAVGIAAAVDYCMATKYSSVRLSELALGIGPFVIGPAVQRKMGLSAFSQLALNPNEWKTAQWAKENGLYHEVFDSTEQLDDYLLHFTQQLSGFNPDSLNELKKVIWEGTEHWDELLPARAALSGRLLLSDFAQSAIRQFRTKQSNS